MDFCSLYKCLIEHAFLHEYFNSCNLQTCQGTGPGSVDAQKAASGSGSMAFSSILMGLNSGQAAAGASLQAIWICLGSGEGGSLKICTFFPFVSNIDGLQPTSDGLHPSSDGLLTSKSQVPLCLSNKVRCMRLSQAGFYFAVLRL